MATVQTNSTLPIEMLVLMIAKQFPYLADELEDILHASVLTREEAKTTIHQTVERYQMRLNAGLLNSPFKHGSRPTKVPKRPLGFEGCACSCRLGGQK